MQLAPTAQQQIPYMKAIIRTKRNKLKKLLAKKQCFSATEQSLMLEINKYERAMDRMILGVH
jgi:hypothetical protein